MDPHSKTAAGKIAFQHARPWHEVTLPLMLKLVMLAGVGTAYAQPLPAISSQPPTTANAARTFPVLAPTGEFVNVVRELSGDEIRVLLSGKSFGTLVNFYTGKVTEVFYRFNASGSGGIAYGQPEYGNLQRAETFTWRVGEGGLQIVSPYEKHPRSFAVGMTANGKFVFLTSTWRIYLIEK